MWSQWKVCEHYNVESGLWTPKATYSYRVSGLVKQPTGVFLGIAGWQNFHEKPFFSLFQLFFVFNMTLDHPVRFGLGNMTSLIAHCLTCTCKRLPVKKLMLDESKEPRVLKKCANAVVHASFQVLTEPRTIFLRTWLLCVYPNSKARKH